MRGRPSRSIVRDRLVEILFIIGKDTAYNLHKHYITLFGPTSQRNIYYQLQKGKDLDIFDVEVVEEKGDFSWGRLARKLYYKIGKIAKPQINQKIIEHFKKR